MLEIIIVLLLSICYIISLIPYLRIKEKRVANNLLNISTLVFIAVYGLLLPANYYLSLLGFNSDRNISIYMDYDAIDFLVYYFAIFCVTHAFLFTIKHRKEVNLYKEKIVEEDGNNNIFNIKVTAIILFLIGVISNYLYLKAYGGYFNYLNYSGLLRSGIIIVNNKYSFIYPFRECILFSSYLFVLIFKNNKKNIFYFVLMIVSIVLSLSVLYSNKGRLGIVLYLLLVMLAMFKKKHNSFFGIKNIFKITMFATIGAILIAILGTKMGRNSDTSFIYLINNEISFAFLNFKKITDYFNINNYRFFIDIVLFPIYILPSSIWSSKLNVITSSTINTIAWYGSAKGVNGVYGEMPIDFVSLSYMQLGYIGIIVLPIFFAIFYHKLFNIPNLIKDNNISQFVKYYIIISIGIHSLFYSDPYLIIKTSFGFIIFIIIYLFINKINKRFNRRYTK